MVVEKAYPVAAVPKNFDPVTATASENIQMTRERIGLQLVLHERA
jgi:hypothetical protein